MSTRRVVVVGAGAIGASVAYRLAQAGTAVTVVEKAMPGGGASSTSFAWVGASAAALRRYHDLNAAGVQGYRRLQLEMDGARWYRHTGCLTWYSDPHRGPEVSERIGELRAAGYPAAALSPAAVLRDLEPDVRIAAGVEHVAYYPDEGYVAVVPMIRHLLDEARRHGARLMTGHAVVGMGLAGNRVTGVQLADGTSMEADRVVVCCGRHTGAVAALAGAHVPLLDPAVPGSPAVGLLARTRPLFVRLSTLIYADELMMRPDGDGRLLVHSDTLDAVVAAGGADHLAVAEQLVGMVATHLVGAEDVRLEAQQIGLRALPEDLLPAVGWTPEVDGLYVVVSHSGITLAPVLGDLVAVEVAGGADQPLLADFRPTRFGPLAP